MRVEIEFTKSATGSTADFRVFFDNDIPHAAEGKIMMASDDEDVTVVNSQFERVLLSKIIKIRGVNRIDVLSRQEMVVECIDTIVDENNEPIFGDDGWFLIHNSLVEAIKNYYLVVKNEVVEVDFYEDYPEDFILGDETLSIEEIEDLEADQSKADN